MSQRASTIELHVTGKPESLESTVRRVLTEIDPEITVLRVTSFGEQVSEAFNQERLLAQLTTLFGALADSLFLVLIASYDVVNVRSSKRKMTIG